MHADGLPDTSTCAMPMRPTAQLDLIHELPLDDITVYRSPTCCVCVGTDADRLNYRVLEFAVVGCVDESSSPPTSSSSTDARNNNNSEEWLPDEIPFISSRLCTLWEVRERVMKLRHQQPTLTVFKACALCGCVRFTQGFYLLCVAARKQVAQVGPHRIFEMTSCRLVPLYAGAPISHVEEIRYMADDAKAEDDVRGKLATMVERSAQTCFSRTSAEAAFLQRFCASDQLRQHCFYSHTYDLTNTLQINMTVPLRGQQQRPRRMKYVWNEFLLEPFFEMDADDDDDDDDAAEPPTTHEVDRSSPRRLRAAYAPWVVHLIHGSVSQCRLARRADSSAYISVLLIGRSSCEFCGPRFLRRGVGMNGHVANHVEVEQIVCDEESLRGGGTSGSYSSYVQVRGSVPVRWFHPPRSTLPRPSVVIGAEDPASSATCAHFRQLRRDYGGPIIVLDLLKQSDATKTSREAAVGNAYRRAMSKLIGACVAAGNDDDDDDVARCSSAVLRYRQIDLRRVADRSWNAVTALAEAEAEDVGLFISRVSGAQSMMMQQQHGIIRTNCLDCIDRTNIAQCFLGMDALGRQLQALLLVQDAAHVALFPNLMQSLLQMYLHLGDAVAQQYGGSAQVGAGVLHRGTGWDQWMGLKRLYGNILTDGEKLISLNLFLGRYQPIPRTRTHAMNAAMRAMTSNLGCARGPSSRQQRRGGVLREALHRVAARTFAMEADHVDRAILPRHLVHEAEIDYYLHVHGAPSVPDGSALQRWWLPVSSTSSIGDDVVDVHEDAHRNALSITQDERLRGCMWMERNTTRDDVQMDVLPAVVVAPDSSLTSTKREELHTTATTTATKDDADVAACWKEESSWCSTSRATLEHVFAPAVVCRPEEAPWYDSATFPDEVRRWRAADVIEDGHAWINVDELQRQRAMAITARFGPPHAWSCAHVLEAIGHAELHFTPEVLRRIQEEGWTGQQLLHGKLVDVGGHRGKRGALHQAFVALANIAQIAAMHTTSTQHKQTNAPLASPLKYASSSPAILPHASDGMCFFTSAPSPASMTQRLSQMMLAMMDPSTGVPRRCFRRVDAHNLPEHLHSTAQQHVPLAAVIPNAFSMRDLHTWLKRRSSTLGLSLHIAKDVDDAGWRCIVWLMMLPLVVPVSPASRVSVLDQLLDTSALYELLPTIPQTILNAHVHHVERPMHVVKPSPVVVMEDLLGNALHRFTSLLAKASRQRSVLLPTARIAYDDLSSAVHVLEDVCLHDASLCAPGARLSFFINCFNLLFIHAWLRVALMEHISAEEEANRHLRLADARRMYWAYAYRIGEVHLSLHEIKHGVLGGNVAATYYVLPPFAADDPRLELIPEEVRAAHADAATPTSRELQLLAMAAFMMDVPERTNSTQHRVEQLRERWLQWRSSVAHAVDALPFALLDTYVDARAYPVAPPPTLCAMNSIAFHHRRLSGRAEFCTMVGSSRKWMKECYAPRDLWAPLHRGMHADLRLRLFLTSSTTLAAMSNNANTDAELVGEGMLDATVSSPRRREHRALHLCEVLSQEHWTEQIERAELSFRRTLAQLVKRSRSGADADCVAQFVRPLHVYASMHAITAEQILSMHCQGHVV